MWNTNRGTPAPGDEGAVGRLHLNASTRRPDIQGLRAIAVIAVVLYHTGLPLNGGFLGVDIFFVISGFVITGMLQREWLQTGRIRIANFWKRRFLRLTPALALVVTVTILISSVVFFPDQERLTVQTGLGALVMVANIVIARNTGGYFDAAAESNPLLNTWSLSVEEQFYIFFPILLMTAWSLTRRLPRFTALAVVSVSAVGLLSFVLAIVGQSEAAAASGVTWLNFYSPVVRVWEFAVGAVLALIAPRCRPPSPRASQILGLVGVIGVGISLTMINSSMPTPGISTLLPVVSTALLILAGTGSHNEVTAALSTRPMVKVGDWSYSIYLWHWPMIVFAVSAGIENSWTLALVALLACVPALMSYRWVETPLRGRKIPSRATFIGLFVAVMAPAFVVSFAAIYVFQPVSTFKEAAHNNYLGYIEENSHPCTISQEPGSLTRCRQSQSNSPINVVLLGDSHAEHLYPGLIDSLPNTNIAYVYLPEWPYLTDSNSESTMKQVAGDPSVEAVVVAARWDASVDFTSELARTVKLMADSGKQVFIANDGPYFSFHAQECAFERPIFFSQQCSESSFEFNRNFAGYLPMITTAIGHADNVRIVDTAADLCDSEICSMVKDDVVLYADQGHLNVDGSRYVVARLLANDPDFREAMIR